MATRHDVRFEPHERPPHVLAAGLGAQMVVLIVTGIMVTPLVVAPKELRPCRATRGPQSRRIPRAPSCRRPSG